MTPDELEELIALDSVGALEEQEKRLLEQALRADSEARRRALEMRETAALLAYTGPPVQPPPALKRRIMNAVAQRVASEAPAQSMESMQSTWLSWGIAALFAVLAGVMAWHSIHAPHSAENRHLRVAHLHAPTVESTTIAELAWDTVAERGSLNVRNMPPTPKGCCYQIWIIAPGKDEPVSGGIFTVAANGVAEVAVQPAEPVSGAEHFLVSLEVAGGVKKAKGPMVLAGS